MENEPNSADKEIAFGLIFGLAIGLLVGIPIGMLTHSVGIPTLIVCIAIVACMLYAKQHFS